MENDFDVAKLIEFNNKAEAQAIYDYTDLLKELDKADLDEKMKNEIIKVISEIIADELNHQLELHELYEKIVGIKANEE